MYELQQTPQYRKDFGGLDSAGKRSAIEALDILRESPKEFKNLIMVQSKRAKENHYRLRLPGLYLYYIIPDETKVVTLTRIQTLRKQMTRNKKKKASFF